MPELNYQLSPAWITLPTVPFAGPMFQQISTALMQALVGRASALLLYRIVTDIM